MSWRRLAVRRVLRRSMLIATAFAAAPLAAATVTVYDNALQNGWQDWGWATRNLAQTAIYQSAPKAISWEPDAWAGLYFHNSSDAVANYTAVRFWINGAGGNQAVRLVIYSNNAEVGSKDLTPLPAAWTQMTVTWADLGVMASSFDGIVFQTNANANQATAYVDDLELVQSTTGPPPGGPVTVAVDPGLDRRTISPLIYGVNWAGSAQLATGLYT